MRHRSNAYTAQRGTVYEDNMRKVTAAFAAIRKHKIFARQNFLCCGSCAGYALGTQLTTARAKGKAAKGAVYYHRQDADHALEAGVLCIGYGAGDGDDSLAMDAETVEVGKIAVQCLRDAGLDVQWDGDKWSRIKVIIWRTAAAQAQFERDGIMVANGD